ncbi:HNH endonuclease [Streptomyces sp. NPDC089915]|uniref:HNH endonuclease n=1 Tax=Streptomyces sp. NPDC089915 TaxID=3155186 RepID=UPI003424B17D
MTIDGVGRSEGGAGGVQWLLQPRGSRNGGAEHFRKTVRQGVALADYTHVLGPDARRLEEVFGDGRARFWGATPAAMAGNAKAAAIRDHRVGDQVLFYSQWKFIARATIVDRLRNPALARALWGEDEEGGATWEHVIALGDVVEFESDARPVLAGLDVQSPLRSLTLVPAADRRRYLDGHGVPWPAPDETRPVHVPAPRKTREPSPAPTWGRRELIGALGGLRTATQPEGPALHKPLALLWALGRAAAKQDRLASWDVFKDEVGPLLGEFGRTGSRVTPAYPFWHLRTSGVWEVHGIGPSGSTPTHGALREAGAMAGFTGEAARLLREARTRAQAVETLCRTYFADADRARLLARTGLDGYLTASGEPDDEPVPDDADCGTPPSGPAKRRRATVTRPERNQEWVRRVKAWHKDICQVCSDPVELRSGNYSEAAHIQGLGSPHDGPDTVRNMLCLCPNHHKQFDRLAIYIDTAWKVRKTGDDTFLFDLRRHPAHVVDAEYVAYHRVLCGKTD